MKKYLVLATSVVGLTVSSLSFATMAHFHQTYINQTNQAIKIHAQAEHSGSTCDNGFANTDYSQSLAANSNPGEQKGFAIQVYGFSSSCSYDYSANKLKVDITDAYGKNLNECSIEFKLAVVKGSRHHYTKFMHCSNTTSGVPVLSKAESGDEYASTRWYVKTAS